MKRIILGAGAVILITAFTNGKGKVFAPPGTVQINDTLFADETEVSNFSWREFVYYNKEQYGKDSKEYTSSLLDTLVWRHKLAYCEPYTEYYHMHPAYNDYPAVGVSYEQAVAFCKWRTERVHAFMEYKEGKRKLEDIRKPYTGKLHFEYRLPGKKEWEALAIVGYDNKQLKKLEKGQLYYNISDTSIYSAADVTAPVYAYIPNRLGVFNMLGNVSEMVTEKGVSKGGNWRTKREELNIWTDEAYTEPNSWTGFRCVCVIKK
jgi:formylglycine-generating enzyme required for sulfatase activity